MPRKSNKSTEPEPAGAPNLTLNQSAESGSPSAAPQPVKKAARKTRSKKSALTIEETSPAPAESEALAQAADTADIAGGANDRREEGAPAPEAPKKKARARKTKASAEPQPDTKPEPKPQEAPPQEIGPDEDAELEGDWESGSGPGPEEDHDEDEAEEQERAPKPPPKLERLQKILAAAGIASRRHAEELIREGRVQVNGKVVTELGSKADAARDHIRVDGKLLHGAERLRYFVLNKPREYVTTVSDPEGRPTVMQFFSKMSERLYPVGRLDYQSEGLLLMTNDGDLANRLTRASSGVEKTYLVKVSGQPDDDLIEQLREGISIDRGRPGEGRVRTAPAQIRQVRVGDNPWFEVSLIEGRNRELRKMFEEIGHHVEKIRRVGYGPLVLDQEPGHYRELEPEELQLLRLAAEGKWKPKRVKNTGMLPREAGRSVDHEGARRGGKPFRGRDDRREQGRSGPPRRDDRRPAFGTGQERRGSDRPPRQQGGLTGRREQGGFAGRRDQGGFAGGREQGGFAGSRKQGGFTARSTQGGFDRREQGGSAGRSDRGGFGARREQGSFARRGEQAPREGGFKDRGHQDQRPPRREYPPRPEAESGRGARGEGARRQGGFGARPEGGSGEKRFGQGRFGAGRPAAGGQGGRSRPQGPREGARPFEDRGERRERPQSFGQRREGGGGERFRPRRERPSEDGSAPRPAGRPQGRTGVGSQGRTGGAAPGRTGPRPQARTGGSSQGRTGSFGRAKTGGQASASRGQDRSRPPAGRPAQRGPSQDRGNGRPPRGNAGRRPGPRGPR